MDFLVTSSTVNNASSPSFVDFVELFAAKTCHPSVMRLNLLVDGDAELKAKYVDAASKHNTKLMNEFHFFDAGFDLFLPDSGCKHQFISGVVNKVDFQVRCCAEVFSTSADSNNDSFYTGFYLFRKIKN